MEMLGGLGVVLALFFLVVAVLWICMPFAIFGTKPILEQIVIQQRETNRLLAALAHGLAPASLEQSQNKHAASDGQPARATLDSEVLVRRW